MKNNCLKTARSVLLSPSCWRWETTPRLQNPPSPRQESHSPAPPSPHALSRNPAPCEQFKSGLGVLLLGYTSNFTLATFLWAWKLHQFHFSRWSLRSFPIQTIRWLWFLWNTNLVSWSKLKAAKNRARKCQLKALPSRCLLETGMES